MKKLILTEKAKIFFFISLILFLFISILAQFYGGFTVDEPAQYLRAKNWFQNYYLEKLVYQNSNLPKDYIRHTDTYGLFTQTISLWITYIVKYLILLFGFDVKLNIIFHYSLHSTSIFFGFLTLIVFFNYLIILDIEKKYAYLAVSIFAFSPVWIGHAFFNYMDLNLAFFFLSSSYFLTKINFNKKLKKKYIYLYLLSIVGIGVTRPQILPIFMLLGFSSIMLKKISIFEYFRFGSLALVLIYIFTPQAWNNPFSWLYDVYFLNLGDIWRGCSQTNYECIGKYYSENWNSIKYMYLWLTAKIPLIILLFLILFFKKIDKKQIFTIFVFLIPILIISIKNLNIYNGLRHYLFLIPLLYLISLRNFFYIISNNIIRLIFFLILFISLLIENLSIFPYNYSYLNFYTRHNLEASYNNKEKIFPIKFELDYWGYSMKENVKKLERFSDDKKIYVDFPKYWDPVILPFGKRLIMKKENIKNYYYISPIFGVADGNKIPGDCKLVDTVNRKYFLGGKTIFLSFVSKCESKN